MFSSNLFKIFFVALAFSCQSCGFWRGQTNATPAPTPFATEALKSAIPFSTKEPDVYQTEIVTIDAGGFEEKTFAAKNGANRLLILDFQGKSETAFLQIGENQNFSIAPRRKIYAEDKTETAAAKNVSLDDFLTSELINRKIDARFETLGAENDLIKYRVSLDDARNSEMLIYVDGQLGLPVRQEFYSIAGAEKKLTLTVELRNFKPQTETGVFEIPKDYRKVSTKEFRDATRRERQK